MYEPQFASHDFSAGALPLTGSPIIVDRIDFEGVQIAATTLSEDFARVTGKGANPVIFDLEQLPRTRTAVIVGSISRSTLIQQLFKTGKLELSAIEGKWETYFTTLVENPLSGIDKALVIVGSDKRGTIFGIYTLSDQIGVSPWYWWAEAPPTKRSEVYALDVTTMNGPPSVKYRGIFINDEAPALSGWVHEKLGPKYNVEFYKKVFELLLRLKANFLWPAMWFGYPHPGSSFFMDDPLNQTTADKYGIVISTSHHEPMQRAMNEWFSYPYNEPDKSWSWIMNKEKITRYFREGAQRARSYESYITMGMRGDGDREMDVEDPPSVLREILSTQRGIIKDTYGKEDGVCQLMALYKEVQEYYDSGLQIPDDITLLFADDNFGTIRRLPFGEEVGRRGRSGIYYHLEYVGEPRSYKWMNSNSCARVWQQLEQAYNRGADQIWIFNVGDIKPLEVPLTFVMTLAWNVKAVKHQQLQSFFFDFACRTLGLGLADSKECSELLVQYDRLMALRRHEHIEPNTFSLVNYGEAEEILERWQSLLTQAEQIAKRAPPDIFPVLFQLVLHPIKASYIYVALRVAQAKNHLYGLQRRNTTNQMAQEALRLFEADFDLSEEYHSLLGGKWNNIMCQPHLGYRETWHAPSRDMISGLSFVQTRQNSNPIAGYMGIAVEGHTGVRPGLCNEESDRTHPSRRDLVPGMTLPPIESFGPRVRWFEIYCRGTRGFTWTISSPHTWLKISPPSGTIDPKGADARVEISVDWRELPRDFSDQVLIDVRTSLCDFDQIHVFVKNLDVPSDFIGHIESDGNLSINATSFSASRNEAYHILPFIGRTPTGGVALAPERSLNSIDFLQYPVYTFTSNSKAILILYFTLTLDTNPTELITYDFQLDDFEMESHQLVPDAKNTGELPSGWLQSVMDNVWMRKHQADLGTNGAHNLKVRLNNENCVLEKIVLDLGGVRESYLGPPESYYAKGKRTLWVESIRVGIEEYELSED